jgi:hypothetical protein
MFIEVSPKETHFMLTLFSKFFFTLFFSRNKNVGISRHQTAKKHHGFPRVSPSSPGLGNKVDKALANVELSLEEALRLCSSF